MTVRLPVEHDGEAYIETVQMPNGPIAKSKKAFTGLCLYILTTRPNGKWRSDFEPALLRDLMEDRQVTIEEAFTAFFEAFSDRFTPGTGIEWRHLWNHIEEQRLGRDRRLYTYEEMLNIIDKENIDTDHFEIVKEGDTVLGFKRK